jgi:hypothetical protein
MTEKDDLFRNYGVLKDDAAQFARLRDAIQERQIKNRRNLLLSGMLALIVGRSNLVPAKIEALGISFDKTEQTNFRYIFGAAVIYFTLVFTQQLIKETLMSTRYNETMNKIGRYRQEFKVDDHYLLF